MLTDKDIKKLIKAQKEIFPTAEMIKRGFDGVDKKFDGLEKRLNKRIDKLQEQNEKDHELLNLRLGEFAYRFEVEDLRKRLNKVEVRLGIKTK